jgi:predicted HTH transcriptional regulator
MNDIHLPQESRVVEYKQQATDLRKIAQTVVAFANGIGGELMVGVEDKLSTTFWSVSRYPSPIPSA